MRKLFLSFSTLLARMAKGEIGPEDFSDGLFYFGSTRECVMRPWEGSVDEYEKYFPDPEKGRAAYKQVVEALLSAEKDGRVTWREPHWFCSYRCLNVLLSRCGFEKISEEWWSYHTDFVKRSIEEASIPLQVVAR